MSCYTATQVEKTFDQKIQTRMSEFIRLIRQGITFHVSEIKDLQNI